MRILYAIQGTGNGHLSRARDIIPVLAKKAEVDILVSGNQVDISLPFEIKYRLKGLSFIFGQKGGVDLLKTFSNHSSRHLLKEIFSVPVQDYDLVINDFEPITAWACILKGVSCVGLSHQSALLTKDVPKPHHKDFIGSSILRFYAPVTKFVGFHFKRYNQNVYTPVIRQEIRQLNPTREGHYTVYLPAYSDERIIKTLSKIPRIKWQVFSKHNKKTYSVNNVVIEPINNERFISSLEKCTGILCGAGFESPAEALFLGKKLMVIPMKGQYEQHFNAEGLKDVGVPVIKKLSEKYLDKIEEWTASHTFIQVNYLNQTEHIIDTILSKLDTGIYANPKFLYRLWPY